MTVQGPVKKHQPDRLSHRGGGLLEWRRPHPLPAPGLPWHSVRCCLCPPAPRAAVAWGCVREEGVALQGCAPSGRRCTVPACQGDHKLSVLLRSVLQRFGGSDRQLVSEEAAEPGPGPSWAPWRLENGGRVYVGIIDFLAPWSSLNISDSLHIPNVCAPPSGPAAAVGPGNWRTPPALPATERHTERRGTGGRGRGLAPSQPPEQRETGPNAWG